MACSSIRARPPVSAARRQPTSWTTPSPSPNPDPSPTPTAACVTASNYAHTQAGRAYHSMGYAYANGSHQNMGLWNTFTITTLKQTGPNHWVVGC